MKKNTLKILMAALSLLMAIGLATGSTFAWFSLNNKVAVTGMNVTTKVSNNILIAEDTLTGTTKKADNAFKTNYPATLSGILEPVSTIDGVAFFYNSTTNTQSTGDAASDSYTAYNAADTAAFNTNYGTTGAVGYLDYAFQLKATNSADAANYVRLTAINLTYNGAAATTEKAFRVAVFVENMGEDGATNASGAVSSTTLKTILRQSGAAYFTTDQAVTSTTALAAVNGKIDDAAAIGEVAAHTNHYYKVIVRLWLEGEDNTCNNETFATLTSEWALDLTIELVATDGTAAVTQLGKANAATVIVAAGAKVDTTEGNWITIDGVTYKPLQTSASAAINTAGGAQVYTADAVGTSMKLYTIEANKYLTNVTTQFDLSALA